MKSKIRKGMILLLASWMFNSCNNEKGIDHLKYINHINKLKLLLINDRCGEWGGDQIVITIYRDDYKGPLLADYTVKEMICNTRETKVALSKSRVQITVEVQNLVIASIDELYRNKLAREYYPSHSGNINRIMLSDSSILVEDFPALEWKKFRELTTLLVEE